MHKVGCYSINEGIGLKNPKMLDLRPSDSFKPFLSSWKQIGIVTSSTNYGTS